MLRFLKKRRNPPKESVPHENPAHQTTDIGAECDRDPGGINRGPRGSRTATRDGRMGDQQLPAQNFASTPTPGHDGGNLTTLQERGHPHRDSSKARSEQPGRCTPDPHSAERDSKRNLEEHEDRGPGVQQPSEATPKRTFGDGQNGWDADDLVQSGKSRVKERGWVDRTLGRAAFAIDLVKGPAEVFGPLKAILESISVVYAQYQNTVAVKDKIEILRSRIAVLEKLFGQPASDEKERKLREGLSIKLKDIEEQLRSLGGKSVPLRYLDNAQDSGDVSGLLEDLQEAVNDYMMVQQMAIYDQGCKLMDAAEQSVLNNFRCARGAEYRHGERKGCLKGTRGAVLNTIELWARDFDKSSVYWLNGLAGTGKSTIAKTVAERLFADGQLGASFFCSRDFEDRRNLQLIFPTLATQLARKYTGFRSILTPLIRSDPNVAYESLYSQMEKLIVRPLNESSISTVIVIDALDECEDEEPASAILSVLGRLVSEIPKVKFFLTGRPEPRVSEGFRLPSLAKMTDIFILHDVEPDQVDSDIRLFFKNTFSELAGRRRGLDNWPTEEQLDRLCTRAAGLFVYASATVKFVDNNKWGPRNQLNALLQSQKIGDREGRALDSLYTSILQGAFGDDRPEYDAKTRSAIGAVVLAANPLSPSTIAVLLGFDAENILPLLSSINSLLILQDDISHPVRPFHKSFPDFVTDPTRCTNSRFHVSPPDHHSQLLIGCLGLMNRTLEKNMCKLPDAVANSDVSDLGERADRYIDPALRYACTSWHTHLIDVDAIPTQTPTIAPTLRQFLETKFLYWLEVLSVLGAARNAVEALQVTMDWLEGSPALDLVNDCFRFVTGNFEAISASSPHIYHSALVVAPQNSIVRKLYGSHAHPLIRVVRGVPTSWDASTAATARLSEFENVVLSPCNKFIAITWNGARTVDVLDSTTLQRLQTLKPPRGVSTEFRSLIFSPDSRILTCTCDDDTDSQDGGLCIIRWDLQTGGVASVIRCQGLEQDSMGWRSTYSADGKIIGVSYRCFGFEDSYIFFCDVASGVLMHSHSLNDTSLLSNLIWTHGESLRFATSDATAITTWEVGFSSGGTPTKVEALSTPEGFNKHTVVELLPAPCRLALVSQDGSRVQVWDARNSRYLLQCTDAEFNPTTSFSPDGRFFACPTFRSDIYLWKESPAGYMLYGILASSIKHPFPLLSRNGESIVVFGGCAIQLWRTKRFTTPPNILTSAPQRTEDFILEFSPDRMLAVAAMWEDNMVTVLDLKSGAPQLTVDANMKVYGLGVVENTVVVVGAGRAVAWNLPTGDRIPDVCVGLEDSSWTIHLDHPRFNYVFRASISPDSRYIILADRGVLQIYSASTGERIRGVPVGREIHRFSPDGHHVWCADRSGEAEAWRVVGGQKVLEPLKLTIYVEHPPKGYPWGSYRGYRVTDDWWILDPDGKRLLLLPPPWRSYPVQRVWKEQFLALLHSGLSEPVILEFDVNRDL